MLRLNLVLAAVMLVGAAVRQEQSSRVVLRQGWPEASPNSPSSAVSGDGRHVAFVSAARLLPVDTNTLDDIYILERQTRRLTLATLPYSGAVADSTALSPQLNGDGRYLGTSIGARSVDLPYLTQIARAADDLGYTGVLLPTGRSCEDAWAVASALVPPAFFLSTTFSRAK